MVQFTIIKQIHNYISVHNYLINRITYISMDIIHKYIYMAAKHRLNLFMSIRKKTKTKNIYKQNLKQIN